MYVKRGFKPIAEPTKTKTRKKRERYAFVLGRVDEAEGASLSGQITSASQAAVQRINIRFVFAVAPSFTLVPQF